VEDVGSRRDIKCLLSACSNAGPLLNLHFNFQIAKVPTSSEPKLVPVFHMLTKEVLLTLLICAGSVFAIPRGAIGTAFSVCDGKGEKETCSFAGLKGRCERLPVIAIGLPKTISAKGN
jgi:hypothetical protein